MNVEDSYEGAVRRLRRLGQAGVDLGGSARMRERQAESQRLRDLEELATLACEENEQLKHQLSSAQHEIVRLRAQVASLQEALIVDQNDHSIAVPRQGRSGVLWFFAVLLIGGAGLAAFQYRPWEHWQSILTSVGLSKYIHLVAPAAAPPPAAEPVTTPVPAAALPTTAPAVPTTTAPAVPTTTAPAAGVATTAPAATTTAPAAGLAATAPNAGAAATAPATTAPVVTAPAAPAAKPEPTTAKAEPETAKPSEPERVVPVVKAKAERRHAPKHHAKPARHEEKKHAPAAAKPSKQPDTDTTDPLSGLNL